MLRAKRQQMLQGV